VIFVDSSFWIALRNDNDVHHPEAAALLRATEGSHLVTSNHVRGETWTFLRNRAGHASAVAYLEAVAASPRLDVVHVLEEMEDVAFAWLRRHDERRYSFVDATSFALMRSMKIKDALAFDADFSAAGFRELRA
jgi:predicted nucleic acid-binding protein